MENSRYSREKGTVKLTSEQLFDISQEIRSKFKHSLANDVTELILLPVDPYHLHAHWTIDAEEIDNPNVKGGSNELVLQFYWDKQQSINQNVSKHFSVNVDFSQSQQNIRLPVDNSFYKAVLGVLDHNQQLTVLAKSNTVHVPRAKSLPKIQKPIKSRPINKAIALVENKNQLTTIVSEKVYDEVQTDTQIKAILLKHYPQRKIDQLLQTISINTDVSLMPVHGVYDEIVINALIQRVLQQQGKDSQLVNDVLRLESHYAASNLSGQNFYF